MQNVLLAIIVLILLIVSGLWIVPVAVAGGVLAMVVEYWWVFLLIIVGGALQVMFGGAHVSAQKASSPTTATSRCKTCDGIFLPEDLTDGLCSWCGREVGTNGHV